LEVHQYVSSLDYLIHEFGHRSPLINHHDSSLGRHVNAAARKSLEI